MAGHRRGHRRAAADPDPLQGRVAAAVSLLLFSAQPLTQAASAALIAVLDYRALYLAAAGLGILLVTQLPRRGGLSPA